MRSTGWMALTFILTDVRFAAEQVVKGTDGGEILVTLMGGTVGKTTALIVAGAQKGLPLDALIGRLEQLEAVRTEVK